MRMLTVALVVLTLSGSASAQQLTLQFANGRVTLDAAEVPVRTILAEWARQGGTKVVNGDRVAGSPLTIRLENVPEAQALEIILRNVAGYMAAPRMAAAAGASTYDRILVMPTSTTVAAAPGAAGRNAQGSAGNRPGRQGFPAPQPAEDPPMPPQEDMTDASVNQPFEFPQQQNPFQAIGQPGPFGTPIAPGGQAPNIQFGAPGGDSGVIVNSGPPQQMPVLQFPAMPPGGGGGGFGTMAVPMPGTVVQPPTQPGQRPPGGR